jgi:hypothetical protein
MFSGDGRLGRCFARTSVVCCFSGTLLDDGEIVFFRLLCLLILGGGSGDQIDNMKNGKEKYKKGEQCMI